MALAGAAPGRAQTLGSDQPSVEFGLDNPIVRENRQPGDNQWTLPSGRRSPEVRSGFDRPESEAATTSQAISGADTWERPPISGYADRTSVEPGGVIRFYVDTTAPLFDLNISRLGWYGGAGGRTLVRVFGLPGQDQPIPTPDPDTGLVAADWQLSYPFTVPRHWPSGVYLARLLAKNENLDASYVLFVVRDDSRVADFVYKVAVNTYQAYNNWGGKSLYPQNSIDGAASKVSFDRPYSQWSGAGQLFDWDYPMIRWLEREGYNVTYVTDLDAHQDNAYVKGRRALLSVGRDEFWSKEMRDHWEAARAANVSLAFLGGNTAYWQVRFEPSAGGTPDRVMVGYKNPADDPFTNHDNSRVTAAWRSTIVGRPENALLGVQWESVLPFGKGYPYVVKAADHWIFDGTGARPGDAWSAIVGYEYDRVQDNGATPPGLVVLSESPVVDANDQASVSNSAYYRNGGMVFAAGTVNWAWALDNWRTPRLLDPRIQRVTANVLHAFRQGGPPVAAAVPKPPSPAPDWLAWLLTGGTLLLVALAGFGIWHIRRPPRARVRSLG